MPSDEKMSIDERRKYLKVVAPRYTRAKRRGRSELLTEMGAVTGLHRKSLIRLMSMPSLERAPKRPRFKRRRYGAAVGDVVRVVWESLDYVCAERLTPVLLDTARQLSGVGGADTDAGGRKRALYYQPRHSTAATGALSTGYSEAAPAQASAT